MSEQDSSHLGPTMARTCPGWGQIAASSGQRTLFSGASEPPTTFDRTERVRAQKYSNSCP